MKKNKKITFGTLIFSIIGMIIFIIVLSHYFVALFSAMDIPEFYANLLGIVVPGAVEIFVVIRPYLKQEKIIS